MHGQTVTVPIFKKCDKVNPANYRGKTLVNVIGKNIFTHFKKSYYLDLCVKLSSSNTFSAIFDVTIGLKKGEPLSLLMFILFINDTAENSDFESLTENNYKLLSMYLILFADDIVLFTTDNES